jgi:hypothetical protein
MGVNSNTQISISIPAGTAETPTVTTVIFFFSLFQSFDKSIESIIANDASLLSTGVKDMNIPISNRMIAAGSAELALSSARQSNSYNLLSADAAVIAARENANIIADSLSKS